MKRFFSRRVSISENQETSGSQTASVEHEDSGPAGWSSAAGPVPVMPRQRHFSRGMTRDAFRRNLENPRFLHKFANYLSSKYSAELLLFWIAAEHHRQELVRVRTFAEKVHSESLPLIKTTLGEQEAGSVEARYSALLTSQDPFAEARENAFEQLFSDYPQFLQDRIRRLHAKDQRSQPSSSPANATNAPSDAASWIVGAPERDSRQCVMMSSERLHTLTGYASLCGKPWTILQGKHDDEASKRIRTACEKGVPGQELLLSFKADGTPFHHLLRSVPLIGKRKTLDGFLFLSWDVTSLVNSSDLDDLLVDELDDGVDGESSFLDTSLQALTTEAVRARLKRQEARHLPASISAAALSANSVEPVKSSTVKVLRQTALRPATSGTGLPSASAAELSEDVVARQDAIADEAVAPFLILDKAGEYITHSDPALQPQWVSGVSFATLAERTASGISSRVRQAARKGQPVQMTATFDLPSGCKETAISLVPLHDSTGRPAAMCLTFLR